jgi:amidase
MRRQLLGIILIGLVWPTVLGAGNMNPADLAGDWIIALVRYGETSYSRMTLQAEGDRVMVVLGADELKLEGTIRDGKIELQQSGKNGPPSSMTGIVGQGEMSGEFVQGDIKGKWKATRVPVRPSNAPREYVFEPKEFHHLFSGAIQPVLHIYPGDTVKTWSLDAGGVDAKGVRRSLGGNPQTGPFYVEGAIPGDTLVVKLRRIRLNRDSAISSGDIAPSAITPGYLRKRKPVEDYNSDWVLDRKNSMARLAKPTERLKNYTVALRPMLGCVGVAPRGDMAFRSGYPGSFGGNMDYNRIREGVTLYLPVYQMGALLFMGDGHAAQGDGELTGNALETSMDIEFGVDIIPGKSFAMPRAEDDEYVMAMGIAGSLNEAFQIATSEMASWLEDTYKLNAAEVASVVGTAMQYDIAEVVDPYVNVVAKVTKKALAPIPKPGS